MVAYPTMYLSPLEMSYIDLTLRDALKYDPALQLKYLDAGTGRLYFAKSRPLPEVS